MRFFLKILMFFSVLNALAQTPNEVFAKANKLYKQEKYESALAIYKQIEAQNLQSDDLFYNMANVYYKTNKVAPAIYYYEKALLLNPSNANAKHNLKFAKRMALDSNIVPLPKTLSQRFTENFTTKISYNAWAWLAICFSVLFVVLFLAYYLSKNSNKKRTFFITSITSIILTIATSIFAYTNFKYVKNNNYAIVFAQKTSVKNAPSSTSKSVFNLHEGTKVKLLETQDNWHKIQLADGKSGWMLTNDFKKLN